MSSVSVSFTPITKPDLTTSQFKRVCDLGYKACGISLKSGKKDLVKARLSNRLRIIDLTSYAE